MFEIEDVGVFLGLDVGKSAHHGHGLTPAGKKVFDKPLPNSEPKLRAVFDKLAAKTPAPRATRVRRLLQLPPALEALAEGTHARGYG